MKWQVQAAVNKLVEEDLKPRHIHPPPEDVQFNYVIDITTKWHGNYLYLVSTYRCPGPNALAETFESRFARLEYAGSSRYNLSFMRHTGQWVEIFTDLPLDEALAAIRDEAWFHP